MPIDKYSAPKVFLYGYYGFGNVGDDLLLQAIIDRIRQYSPQALFVVRSLTPVAALQQDAGIIYGDFEKILSDTSRNKISRLLRYSVHVWKALKGCRIFIFGGGTLFHATSRNNLVLLLLITIMTRLRGSKVFAIGVGVANIPAGFQSILLRLILHLTEDFAVRDQTSEANCMRLTMTARVHRTADLVFSLPVEQNIACKTHRIGITLAASDSHHEAALIRSGAILSEGLCELQRCGWIPVFLSFQELDSGGLSLSDSRLCARVFSCMQDPIMEYQYASSDLEMLTDQMKSMDLIFGMRFHSLVVAAMLGKPFVGFGGDEKLRNICYEFGMPFISIIDISRENILSSIEAAMLNLPDSNKLEELKIKSEENFAAVLESLRCV